MGNCLPKKNKMPLAPIKMRETLTEILEKEIEAFTILEYMDISKNLKNKYGKEIIDKKIYQQYYWIKNNKIENPDLYIPLSEWETRYN